MFCSLCFRSKELILFQQEVPVCSASSQRMSVYVGWFYSGKVKVFHQTTEETTSYKVTEVNESLTTFDKSLDEIQTIVNVADVKQLVFVHDSYGIKSCKSIVDRLTDRGFKSVHVQHWISTRFQTLLLKQNVEFAEGEHFLLAVKGDNELPVVWRYCNNRIEFVKRNPLISPTKSNLSTSFQSIFRSFNEFKMELFINMDCARIYKMVKKSIPECRIVDQIAAVTEADEASTALWLAKRQDGLVDGVEVGNLCWKGVQICIETMSIFDASDDGIPLPFNWSSEWKLHESALTASATDKGFYYKLKIPANRRCRINVKIDRNGSPDIYVELMCALVISLSQDSFYLVRSSDFMDGKVVSIGQFPTAVQFDSDPPRLADTTCGSNVIADAIEMLDAEQQPKNGWKHIRTLAETVEFCKFLEVGTESKLITASYVVSVLFDNIKSLIANVSLNSDGPISIALSRFLTQKQREKLTDILNLKQPDIKFVDEILAAVYGYSMEKGRCGVTLVVDLRTTGCRLSLFRVEDKCCIPLVQQDFAELNSENIRHAMNVIYSSQFPMIEPTNNIKIEMNETIVKFREAVSTVVGIEQINVKNVLLIGSCLLLPKLTDLFAWSFFHANVDLLEEPELGRFAAVGSILLHFNTLNTVKRKSLSGFLCP